LNTKNSIRFLNILSILVLLFGFVYIFLAEEYMGFERDLVYRAYILETVYLKYINFIYFGLFWATAFAFTCKEVFSSNFLHVSFQLIIYFIISVTTFLYTFEILANTILIVLLNIFGFFRVMVAGLRKKG